MSGEAPARKEREQKRLTEVPEPDRPAATPPASEKAKLDTALTLLFKPEKTFRDAIHRDIMLTKLEVQLVNTSGFQRLRRIKQLGATNLVYPSAVHTRFEHSIGTLAVAIRLLALIDRNPVPDAKFTERITDHDRLMTRLCALLHDLAHVPYGHSLEDEGQILPAQWKDSDRVRLLLGPDSEVSRTLTESAELNEVARYDASFSADRVREEIVATLVAIESHTSKDLRKPYIADIVGNTVCADLLDYLVRDMTFLGLQERPDDRFLSYLYLKLQDKKPRVVLRLSKPRGGEIRRDVQSEFVQLLRLRYSLAEKALYHHTKIAATSMIMSAVADVIVNGENGFGYRNSLFTMGDEELVRDLVGNGTPAARKLAEAFRDRKIYKPLFLTKRSDLGSADFTWKNTWVKWFCGRGFRDDSRPEDRPSGIELAGNRVKFERALEHILRLDPGDVSLYCPPPKIGAKLAATLVEVQGVVGEAHDCLMPIPKSEVRSIAEKHEDLWSLFVFYSPKSVSREKAAIGASELAKLFRCVNSVSDFQDGSPRRYLDLYEDACVAKTGTARLPNDKQVAIEEAVTRGGTGDLLISPDSENYFWISEEAYNQRRDSYLSG
jgi:uncharacterized protein